MRYFLNLTISHRSVVRSVLGYLESIDEHVGGCSDGEYEKEHNEEACLPIVRRNTLRGVKDGSHQPPCARVTVSSQNFHLRIFSESVRCLRVTQARIHPITV